MVYFLLFSSLFALASASCPDLSAVAVVYRHGLRTPSGTYKNDPYADYYWPTGYEAPVLAGGSQLYYHGQRLRTRYNSLVQNGGWYTALNINVQSSVKETAIIGGLRFNAGFLPPPNESENPLPIWWQAVAVNTISRENDNKILSTAECPAYDQAFQNYIANPPQAIQDILNSYPDWYVNLSCWTGEDISTISDIYRIYSILDLERDNGLALSDWATNFLTEAEPFVALYLALVTQTPYMQKAKQGALFTEILQRFEGYVSGTESRQISQYSGHESTILGLARILGVYDQIPAISDFGVTISLELCGCNNTVEAYYWANGLVEEPQQLYLPNCPAPCTLENFRVAYSCYLIEPATLDEYARICEV